MKIWRLLPAALAGALALQAAPAAACSISFTQPRDPAVRYAGTDARHAIGTFRIERIEPPRGDHGPALIYGRLMTRRGTGFDVVQPYYQILVDCAAYDLPMGDAEGTFYLSRRAYDGRYWVLGWRGRHIPGNGIIQPGEEGRQ